MLLDVFALRALAREIGRAIVGSRIASAALSDRYTLLVTLKQDTRLVLSASPDAPVVFLSSREAPASCISYFDDRLTGAVVMAVRSDRFDRVITIELVNTNQLGRDTSYSLVAELTGRNSNLILVDAGTGRIVHALRRVTGQMSRMRRIAPGVLYSPPPLPGRILPERGAPPDQFVERVMAMAPLSVADRLMRVLPGLTKASSAAMIRSALGREDARRPDLDREGDLASFQLDEVTCRDIWNVAVNAYADADLDEKDAEGIPGAGRSISSEVESISMEAAGRSTEQEGSIARKTLIRRMAALDRKLAMLQADLSDTEQLDILQQKGHILMANLHKVPSWCSSVKLEDFYAGDGRTITIEIDPSISPVENARRYVARARKAKVRQSATAIWVSRTKDEYERIRSMVERLDCGQASADEIRRIETRESSGQSGPGTRDLSERHRAPTPRRYVTTDGWNVLVGRSDHENDRLLTEVALSNDTWMHAQGCPGSHVIIRGEGHRGDVPRRTLEEAASLAAYWSKARGSKVVPVIYTRVKYVRKSKGAPPGAVTVTHEKTIFVAPRALPIDQATP